MERLARREQPHIKFGMFKIRIPFIHYRFEKPEAIQGIISSMTSLGTIVILVHKFWDYPMKWHGVWLSLTQYYTVCMFLWETQLYLAGLQLL